MKAVALIVAIPIAVLFFAASVMAAWLAGVEIGRELPFPDDWAMGGFAAGSWAMGNICVCVAVFRTCRTVLHKRTMGAVTRNLPGV